MARTWLMLGRVVVQAAAQPEHATGGQAEEAEHAAVGQAEEAAHAAVGQAEEEAAQAVHAAVEQAEDAAAREELEERVVQAAEMPANIMAAPGFTFTFSVAPPPRVTLLTARGDSQPGGQIPDMYPYVIATAPFCLLAHFSTGGFPGTDFAEVLGDRQNHHLVVVRHFRRADDHQIEATAERLYRPVSSGLKNIESICLVSDGAFNYRIAELSVSTSRRNPSLTVVVFRSGESRWLSEEFNSPLAGWDRTRKWVPHGAVAVRSTAMWFDLSWGILACDVGQEKPEAPFFYRLPRGRAVRKGGATEDIHTRRCIAVSGDLLRYVEIITPDLNLNPNGEPAVSMWSLRMDDETRKMRWVSNYHVSLPDIWNDASYTETRLRQEIPVLTGVSPVNPAVVYFELDRRLFGVNIPDHRVVDYEGNTHQLVSVPDLPQEQSGSSRFLITWNLLPPGPGEIGHVSPDQKDDFPGEKDEGPQDGDGKGKSKAKDARQKSTPTSSRPLKSLRIK